MTSISRDQTVVAMDTLVTVQVEDRRPAAAIEDAIAQALAWFPAVEQACSRFDPTSELSRLCRRPGEPVAVSPLLIEPLAFALAVAEQTGGRFDPAVGAVQQQRGFRHSYRPPGAAPVADIAPGATFRDVRLDRRAGTVTLLRPLLLDLGAVAKGMAIDLAARELAGFDRFAVEAGGDLYAGGCATAAPWRIGVRDPRGPGLAGTLTLRNLAVCSSGSDQRPAPAAGRGEHHIVDARTGRSPQAAVAVTVIAPAAMTADALATAALLLGPARGRRLLQEQGVAGIIMGRRGPPRLTAAWPGALQWSPTAT